MCASLQYTLIQIILHKIEKAANEKHLNQIVIGGGVAANSEIRKQLDIKALARGWEVFYPPLAYTTDNAAMIGIVGHLKYKESIESSLNATPSPRLTF